MTLISSSHCIPWPTRYGCLCASRRSPSIVPTSFAVIVSHIGSFHRASAAAPRLNPAFDSTLRYHQNFASTFAIPAFPKLPRAHCHGFRTPFSSCRICEENRTCGRNVRVVDASPRGMFRSLVIASNICMRVRFADRRLLQLGKTHWSTAQGLPVTNVHLSSVGFAPLSSLNSALER